MSKKVILFVLASTILSCLAFFITAFNPLQSAHAARVKPVAAGNFTSAYCSPTTDGESGWQLHTHGGFVGKDSSSASALCTGSYYSIDSTKAPYAAANWGLNSPSTTKTGYVWVYIPANSTGATKAWYTVINFTQQRNISTFVLNQRSVAGWHRLGQISYGGGSLSMTASVQGTSQGNLLVDAVTVSNH